jgi:hypothetical protein
MSGEKGDAFQEFIEVWQQNVDALRRFTDAFNGRDLAALLSSCDPNIEVASGRVLMGAPTYRGPRGWSNGSETWLWLAAP